MRALCKTASQCSMNGTPTPGAFVNVLGEGVASWPLSVGAVFKAFRIDESSVHVASVVDRLGVTELEGLCIPGEKTAKVVSETDSTNFQSGRFCMKGIVESSVPK